MIYYRFSVSLALAIASCVLIATKGLTREFQLIAQDNHAPPIVTQNEANSPELGLPALLGNYESYLQAGSEAEANGNYQQAVEYYQQALALNPEDSQLKILLRNVTGYAFDSYMQAGYAADRRRNYNQALHNFRQALKLKPDSFHAQQAIRNVTNYLAFNSEKPAEANGEQVTSQSEKRSTVNSEEQTDNAQWVETNKIWFLLGMGITSVAIALILYNLFRSEKQTVTNSWELPDPETPQAQTPESESPLELKSESPTATPSVNPEIMADSLAANNQAVEPIAVSTPVSVASTENHQLLKPKTNSATPESIGKVTIVTSKTTKIDLVFELIKDLQEGDREVRRKAIWELAQKSDSRGISPLIEMMPQVDSLERNLILEAITQITSRTLQPMNRVLLESLEDDNPQVRKNAIRDLTRLYHLMSKVTKRLSQMTEDGDLEVQQTAKWALQQLDRVPAAKQAMQGDQ